MLNEAAYYVVFVVFVAMLVRSTMGFGEGLVAVALLALRVPVAVAAPLSVLVAGAIVVQGHRKVDVRSAAGLACPHCSVSPLGCCCWRA